MELARKERFFDRKKIVEKNLSYCSLNKKIKLLNEKQSKLVSNQALESFKNRSFKIWLKRFKI
jgi:hypothetical protein